MIFLLISDFQIFFRDKDFIKEGSKQYDDFWLFFKKYQLYQNRLKQKGNLTTHSSACYGESSQQSNVGQPFSDLPQSYHPRYFEDKLFVILLLMVYYELLHVL